MSLDLLIDNARIVDGTGASAFRGAVGVRDNEVVAIVENQDHDLRADETVDIGGAVIAPGFVDIHPNADVQVFSDPLLEPLVDQGVTTAVFGHNSYSLAPLWLKMEETQHWILSEEDWKAYLGGLYGRMDREWSWGSIVDYLNAVEESGVAPNVGTLVGHGTARFNVIGLRDIAPANDELEEFGDRVEIGLTDGALGVSTSQTYLASAASEDELEEISDRMSKFDRPLVVNLHGYKPGANDAVSTALALADSADVRLHVSNIGLLENVDELMAANERGRAVTGDHPPYPHDRTTLDAFLPEWALEEGEQRLWEHLEDKESRERMRREFDASPLSWDRLSFADGQTVAETAVECDVNPVDVVCDRLIETGLGVEVDVKTVPEEKLREVLSADWAGVVTDGTFVKPSHPRTTGAFPELFDQFVRDGSLDLPAAVRKATSLPARVLGLESKGVLREGADADMVVFDPETIASTATFTEPTASPEGVHHVLVNGEFVVRDGEVTGRTPGQTIRRS